MSKIIAVYGNSGSYKTTTAVKLTMEISKRNPKASIVIVGLDDTKPIIPILFPARKENGSLGKILAQPDITQNDILKNMVTLKDDSSSLNNSSKSNNIAVIGYKENENKRTYAQPTDYKISDFFIALRHLVDYVIVDCNSNIASCLFSTIALIQADSTVHLVTCDINGLVFAGSQNSLLFDSKYGFNDYVRVFSMGTDFLHDVNAMEEGIGYNKPIILPYCKKIKEQYNSGTLFDNVSDNAYNAAIKEIEKKATEVRNES